MPASFVTALFFGCIMSVPLACFAIASLYRRAGFGLGWTITLHVVGAIATLGVISFFGGSKDGSNSAGVVTIFVTAIIVTSAALALAIRKWPTDAAND